MSDTAPSSGSEPPAQPPARGPAADPADHPDESAADLAAPAGLGWVGALVFGLVTVGPMLAIESSEGGISAPEGIAARAITAALGTLFRTSARTMMRSTIVTALRTTSRTASRRLMRAVAGPLLVRIFPNPSGQALQVARRQSPLTAVGLSAAALFGSMVAICHRLHPELRAALPLGGDPFAIALGASLPLLLYYALLSSLSRVFGARFQFVTRPDGLLLQAYFTMAGSFLPLTSDAELDGDPGAVARTAGCTLVALTALYWISGPLAEQLHAPLIAVVGAMSLLYAFVFSFPLRPLDGGDVFVHSKLGWLVIWLFVGASFVLRFPQALYGII